MSLSITTRIDALAIGFPVRNAIDAKRIRFTGRLLQTTPNEVIDIVIECSDFTLHWVLGVLGGERSRLSQTRVVTGHRVDTPALNAIVIVGTQQDLRLHVPVGNEAVIPLVLVAMLTSRQEGCAFLDQGFEWFSREEFEKHVFSFTVTNGQPVLAEFAK